MRLDTLRPLGRSGIHVSRLGLGCTTFGREIDEAACFAIMDRAFELGMRLFDTAEAYGGGQSREYRRQSLGVDDQREVSAEMHSSEKIIGRWLRSRGVRDHIVLVTKKSCDFERAAVWESLSRSLERLQTDRVDVYLYHSFDASTPPEEAAAAMDEVLQSGLARAGGCSNYDAPQLRQALDVSRANGLRRFEVIQNNYNLAVPGIAGDLLPLCRREELGVLAYSPLGAGFLTGKYTPDRTNLPAGSRFHVIPGHVDVYFSDRNFRVVDRLHEFAARVNVPAQRLAMAWVLQHPDVTNMLVGSRTTEQLENAMAALAFHLPSDWLDEMNAWN
ncbi:MAG: aldo/keto reductase [Acidobacteria bacterium]|nr:aldo/keto reductase [Acidobacteriota bacterium]